MAGTLLSTKLQVPPLRPNLVSRPRLVDRLDSGVERGDRLTLVSAPAGYGKTSLVLEWLQQTERPPAWLSLDEGDNDPMRFLYYLIAALQRIAPGIGQVTQALLQAPQPPTPETALTPLVNELAASHTPFVLVLDDYHLIQNPVVHSQISFILTHQPSHMHQVVATREDPPLPISRLRGRGQLTEIRQGDLRFETAEIAHFLETETGRPVAAADLAALERRTEGWIAGLQLAALALAALPGGADQQEVHQFVRAFSGSSRYVLDFLIDEVLARQPGDVQDFLLRTSILDTFTAPLCDAVAERSGSQAILEGFEQANLFLVPIDQSRQWFRYHRLFVEFLRHRLRVENAGLMTRLHGQAASWYEAAGYNEDAVKHALAAGDWPEAERLIALATAEVVGKGQYATLHGWLEKLPGEIVRQSYALAVTKGWSLFMAGQGGAAAEYAKLADELLPTSAPGQDRGALASLQAILAMSRFDIGAAAAAAREALAALDDSPANHHLLAASLSVLAQAELAADDLPAAGEVYRQMIALSKRMGQPFGAVNALSNLAWLTNLQGRRQEAVEMGRLALSLTEDASGGPQVLASFAYLVLGMLAYEADDLAAARADLQRTVDLAELMGPASGVWHNGLLALAQLQQACGEHQEALATLVEARRLASLSDLPQLGHQVAAAEAGIRLRQGDAAAAERWSKEAGISPAVPPNLMTEAALLTYARLLLDQERPDEAQALLVGCEASATDGQRRRSQITIQLLRARAALALGDPGRARDSLAEAVRLAAPEDYRRAFLDEDAALLALLPGVRPVAPKFVDELLQAARRSGALAAAPVQSGLVDPLSERELEVLRLLAEGLSNREIAARLFISVGTVKSHLHHIYGKLDVSGRTAAAARARELQLL